MWQAGRNTKFRPQLFPSRLGTGQDELDILNSPMKEFLKTSVRLKARSRLQRRLLLVTCCSRKCLTSILIIFISSGVSISVT